jgi:glycosyltransferase involved in cell wall biosynthesis
VPTVVEINADDKEEAKLRRARARLAGAYNELNRRVLLSRARGLVCVTHELAASPHFAGFGKQIEVIGNGVDLEALRPLPPAPAGDRPRVAFLGSARQAWHGIDKIAHLAEQLPQVDVDVIGYDNARLREALGDRVPANMHPHGIRSRAEFEPILAACDLAFGTLALHRKNMREACPLKVREYLGYGVPVVIGYEDTDLRGVDDWWLLRLPNAEDNVAAHVGKIAAFLESVRRRRVPRELVADRIGSEAKERRRLEFLERMRAA